MSSQADQQQRFARLVIAGFEAAGHSTDAEVVAAGGPSTTYMTQLRKVADGRELMADPRNATLRRIDKAARWSPGSAREVWGGAEAPSPGDHTPARGDGFYPPEPAPPTVEQLWSWTRHLVEKVDALEDRIEELEDRASATSDPPDVRRGSSFPTVQKRAARRDEQ